MYQCLQQEVGVKEEIRLCCFCLTVSSVAVLHSSLDLYVINYEYLSLKWKRGEKPHRRLQ